MFRVDMSGFDQRGSELGFADVFSLPRVAPVAEKKGLCGVQSYDLLSGWNFLNPERRQQCAHDIARKKPRLLIVSPPCGPFPSWQHVNRSKRGQHTEREMISAKALLGFASQLCELQAKLGKYFIFKHPSQASSWRKACVQQLMTCPRVEDVFCDHVWAV